MDSHCNSQWSISTVCRGSILHGTYPDKKDEHPSDDRDGMAVWLVPKPYIVGMEPRGIGKCSRTCAVDGCNGEGSQSVGRKHGNTNDRAQAE
jgi:hypothetical protein